MTATLPAMIFLAIIVGVVVSRRRGRLIRKRTVRHAARPAPPGAGQIVVYDPDIPGDAIVPGDPPDSERGPTPIKGSR